MKAKKAIKTFICILTVVLAVSLTACESDNGADDTTSPAVSTADSTDSSESPVYDEETKPGIESAESEPEEPEPTYYHAAICGAVVTEQDGSTRFTYVKKCENCGMVQSGKYTTNAAVGVLHGSFLCFGCKETQQFEIETTQN